METESVNNELGDDIISQLVLSGDLRGLSQNQKVAYYKTYCERLGLDPATQPLKLLKLQGREILYCDRSGAQQLNRKHNIGHQIMAREVVNECYVVTARAQQSGGRFEESIGAVPILGLKGEALCNAMMKAETKAKRRSTLDLCGLGMLDESEIGEWAAGGETSDIEGKETRKVMPPKTFQEVKRVMKEPASVQGGEEWKNVVCTGGKKDGPIRGKKLGQIAHMTKAMDWLFKTFVEDLKVVKESDQAMREGLIAWNTWRLEQASKRDEFEQQEKKRVEDSWEQDYIPMEHDEEGNPI
jgi:hypothetical protein